MARYFFHIGDSDDGLDREGEEYGNVNLARIEAARTMGELLRDKAGEFWNERSMKLTVTNAEGLILFVLDLSATEAPAVSRRDRG